MANYEHKLGVGLVPSSRSVDEVYALVTRIGEAAQLGFATAQGVSIPHLTLFQGKYRSEEEVVERVRTIDFSFFPREARVLDISVWAKKIVFLDLERTEGFRRAHEFVFHALFPLCEGKSADPQKFEGITAGQEKSFEETGYPFSLAEYLPHITLAHLGAVPQDALREESRLRTAIKDFLPRAVAFEKLVVYRVGPLGSCTDIVWERKLS